MRTFLRTIACSALLLAGVNVDAQTINLNGNSDQVWRASSAGAAAGQWLDLGAVSIGDNRSDLIIGAPGTGSMVGAVYVIYGGPPRSGELSLNNADAIISGTAAGDKFGFSTAAGNVVTPEGSLTRNLIVGAPGAFGGKGALYVYPGPFNSNARLTTGNATYVIIGRAGDQLGSSLATADLNNDGFREIIAGAAGNDKIYVIAGSSTLSGTKDLSVSAPSLEVQGTGLGDVLAAGDVTGDGISDLLAGSGDLDVVYLYKGRATGGIPTTPDAGFNGVKAGDRAGSSLRLIDVDHDGIRDVMIGAPLADGPNNDRADAGSVYILWGSPTLGSRLLIDADVTFYGGVAGMRLGTHVSAGDVNRDQPSDLVMMGPGAAGNAGELAIYYGRTNRASYGTLGANGKRHIDLASPTAVDRRIQGDPALGAIVFTQVFEVTGEGARDIVASVPSENGGAGAVYFTISPSLGVNQTTLSIVTKRNSIGTSAAMAVTNRSIIPVGWATSVNQPWLSSSATSGSVAAGAPASVAAVANTNGMDVGNYTGTLTVRSTSNHVEMLLNVGVNLRVTDTLISIDSPAEGSRQNQPFTLSGWAIERSATSTTGVDKVHVYAFRNDGSGAAPQFIGEATYGQSRTDVAGAFGAQFGASGFNISVSGLAPGPYQLVAYARNAANGAFDAAASRGITINESGLIWIDAPAASSTVTSAFEVGGWAIDPAATSGTGVDGVQFYIFPNGGTGAGVFLGNGSYGWARSDVGAAFGTRFANSGYHFTVTGMMPGDYLLGVYAPSTVTSSSSVVKTVRMTVNANTLMSIDTPSPESTVTTPTFGISGWAIDRSAPSGTGVDTLHIYAYPNPGSGQAPIFLGVATVGIARSDVAALYGSRFTNSGYVLNINWASAGLSPGVYNIVSWAHSSTTDQFNNFAVVRIRIQ
jgi:hypothetical protein